MHYLSLASSAKTVGKFSGLAVAKRWEFLGTNKKYSG